jgi:hypothetical protein
MVTQHQGMANRLRPKEGVIGSLVCNSAAVPGVDRAAAIKVTVPIALFSSFFRAAPVIDNA